MRMIEVFVDEQQGPLAVRTLQGVSGHERMAVGVFDIARSAKKLMLRITLFYPLLGHELRSEELRGAPANLIIFVEHEHVVRPPAVGTRRMRWRIWQVVIIVCRLATSSQETAK